jgi:O-antigen ligase
LIVNLLAGLFGILVGNKSRANLLYLYLMLYPFDGSFLNGTGIAVFNIINYAVLVPLLLYLTFDIFVVKKATVQRNLAIVLFHLGILYLYVFTRYLVALNPLRDSYFLVLTSGFLLMFGVLYYYDQLKITNIMNIFKILICIELYVVILQAIFGTEPNLILRVFDFSQFNHKMILNQDYYRGTGTFQDPNYFALFLATISSFLMINFSFINAGVYLLGIIAILLSFSRMGMILGGILLIIFFIKFIKFRHKYKYLGMILVLLVALLLVLQLFNSFPVQARWSIEKATSAIQARFYENSDFDEGGRGFIFESYFHHIIQPSNVILGLGFLNFQMELQRLTGVNLVAHNEYLQIFADLGLVGVGIVFLVLYQIQKNTGLKRIILKNPYSFTLFIILSGNLFLSTTLYVYVYFFYALFAAYIINNHRSTSAEIELKSPK